MREERYCPSCGNEIVYKDFKNSSSWDEFRISGLCQDCIDIVY